MFTGNGDDTIIQWELGSIAHGRGISILYPGRYGLNIFTCQEMHENVPQKVGSLSSTNTPRGGGY